jgi:putative transposase
MTSSRRKYPRRPPRLPTVYDTYRHSPVYFVTFCTYQRRPWLAHASIHAAFLEFIQRGWSQRQIAVGRYVIMPDHIHLLVAGGCDFALGSWVKLLKQSLGKATGAAPGERRWLEGFFDHLIRGEEKLAATWEYLRQNPKVAGLGDMPADWPYQGEFIALERVD